MPSFRQHTLGLSADIDRVTPTGARPMTTITLVTGASRGLGRNTALSIARHGGDVVITYRSQAEEAQAVVAEIVGMGRKAIAFQLDTGDVAAFLSFADSCAPHCAKPGRARRSTISSTMPAMAIMR
jgi:NAD(P)-dependent dehydrogenase (short-subunit alcohol dehydrogenase family)